MIQAASQLIDPKQRILDVAARLFREQGYASVSLRTIASGAGMKAGSLYYHFSSKEELIVEILNQGIQSVHLEVEQALRDVAAGDGRAILLAAIRAHLRSLFRKSDYTSANIRIFGQVPDNVRAQNMEVRRAYEALWDKLIMQLHTGAGAKPTKSRVRVARLMVLGALNASLEWFNPKQGGVDRLAEQYADLIWNGFGATFSNGEEQ